MLTRRRSGDDVLRNLDDDDDDDVDVDDGSHCAQTTSIVRNCRFHGRNCVSNSLPSAAECPHPTAATAAAAAARGDPLTTPVIFCSANNYAPVFFPSGGTTWLGAAVHRHCHRFVSRRLRLRH